MTDSTKPYAVRALAIAVLVGLGTIAAGVSAQSTGTTPPVATPPVATPPVATPPVATPPAETPPAETPPAETPVGQAVATPETPPPPATTAATATTPPGATSQTVTEGSSTGSTTATTTTVDPATTTTATTATSTNADEAAETVQTAREPLAWRNSYFNYSINASFCSFTRDCQLTYNPTVYQFLSLSPRWYLDGATFFSLYLPAYQEFTQDDSATYANEFQLFDTRIALNHRIALGDNFMILPSVGAWIPTSKSSQAAQRYFRLGAGFSASWLPNVGYGFSTTFTASYYRWFAGSNVSLTHSPYPACTGSGCMGSAPTGAGFGSASSGPSGGGAGDLANQASSHTSEADRITTGLVINLAPFEGFTITALVYYFWINGYNATAVDVTTQSGTFPLPDSSSHWRAHDSYSIYFQYDFVPWFQGWIGFSNSTQLASVFSQDGSVRSPVNLYDMQVAIGTTITLDSLYETFATAGEDDGLTPEQRQRRRQGLARRSTSGGSL